MRVIRTGLPCLRAQTRLVFVVVKVGVCQRDRVMLGSLDAAVRPAWAGWRLFVGLFVCGIRLDMRIMLLCVCVCV